MEVKSFNMIIKWINPETQLPQVGEGVIFKTKVFHTERTYIGSYQQDGFFAKGNATPEVSKTIWGWYPFTDSEQRD